MGQPITVSVRAGGRPEVRFFDANRSLTGMAIETYVRGEDVRGSGGGEAVPDGQRPPDVLARRLFDLGAQRVTIYSNVVTVEAPAAAWAELEPKAVHTIEHLFEYYGDDAGWSFEARGLEYKPSPVQ
jgi:hypothetical protein